MSGRSEVTTDIHTQSLTCEGVGPEGKEGQGEDQVPHTGVGLKQCHQGQHYVGKKQWLVTVEWAMEVYNYEDVTIPWLT